MKKILLGIIIGVLTLSSVCFAEVQSLQSRPDRARLSGQSVNQFFILARNMEADGGILGKSATINASTGAETTATNNIDSHMAKNTEFGAAAILAVSQYGYQTRAPETNGTFTSATNYTLGDSTTGASGSQSYYYGLFDMGNVGNVTYTASIQKDAASNSNQSILYSAARNNNLKKYVDYYTGGRDVYFYGDATSETLGWRGATNTAFVSSSYPIFVRNGKLFGVGVYTGQLYGEYTCRTAIVCGSGM